MVPHVVFGFNTDIHVGPYVLHVQTEAHGPANPILDTTVYARGRVLHRQATSYRDFLNSPGFNEEALRLKLEEQHRAIINELRTGRLHLSARGASSAPAAERQPTGILVTLLNPASWLAGATASLRIEVRSRETGLPLHDARVIVSMEGELRPLRFQASTDTSGLAELSFPVPRLGPGGAELIIRATAPAGLDETRYSLRPRARPSLP